LSQFKNYHPSGNPKINYLSIFQSLKLHILMENILSISLKLNFNPNILGYYGLRFDMLDHDLRLGLVRLDFVRY